MSDYTYDCLVLNVVDGDTCDVSADCGFDIHFNLRVRLFGINAPEIHSKDANEKAAGLKAKDYLMKLIGGKQVVIETLKDSTEKFGRYLAKVKVGTLDVNDDMVKSGNARPYFGGKR